MASTDASASAGPRYAPDDPTLPQPWKGLIDGSTGVLYYWNPETNVTQYEKPTALPPPLPPGPPPAVPTPKLNPIPTTRTLQSDGVQNQQNMQTQTPQGQQQIQLAPQVAQQQVPLHGQLQGSHVGPGMQQQAHLAPEQIRTQTAQLPGQQVPSPLGQMHTQPGQQGLPQAMPQISMQPGSQTSYAQMQQMPHGPQGQMYFGSQMGNPHGFQFNPHQTQHPVHQQSMPPQGPQSSSQPSQHLTLGSQLPHQPEHMIGHAQREETDFHHAKKSGFSPARQHMMHGQQFPLFQEQKTGIPQIDDAEFQQGKKSGFSPAQNPQTGMPPVQNLSAATNSAHAPKMGIQPSQTNQYGGSSVNMQQTNPSLPVHQHGTDLSHPQHGFRFPSQMDPGMMHNQHQNLPPVGSKMAYEENHIGRAGNDYNYSGNKAVHPMHQLPKLAPLPMTRNQQEMRTGDFPQNATPSLPGRLNGPGPSGGPALHGIYGHASGAPPFPNNAFVRPPLTMMGPSDPIHLSAAEVYRQKHEVTATGEDVPAPFMTFEATGFPPEILQEVRYLLQRGSTCRTLHCYAHICATTILSF